MKPRRISLLSCCLAGACEAVPAVAAAIDCPRVHVFAARETSANPGFGSAGTLVELISNAFPGTRTEAIDYPAEGGDRYEASVTEGIQSVIRQTNRFIKACPDTILIMHGYSQGAQIIDDAFCGGPDGDAIQSTSAVISERAARNVAAMVFMGDPRFTTGRTSSIGNATIGGFAARPEGYQCDQLESRIQSYCDSPDPFCSDGDNATYHQTYGKTYGERALKFVVSKMIV